MSREWITDRNTIFELIDNQQLRYINRGLGRGYTEDTHGLWRRVPRHIMRALIDMGEIQPPRKGARSWIHRRPTAKHSAQK